MAPGVCFSITSLTAALLASAAGIRRTASLYTYSECLGTSGCPRLSARNLLSETMSNYMSAPLCRRRSATKLGRRQALVHLNKFWRMARTARAWRRLRAGLKPRKYASFNSPSMPRPSTGRAASAKLALFSPCAKICLDGPGLGSCKVWWRGAAGKGTHSCSWNVCF